MQWSEIENLVPEEGDYVDFEACLRVFPQLELAKSTPQGAFHREGDVWTHTQMVVHSLLALDDYRVASREDQRIVFLAALLHDIAKCHTTVVDPVSGDIGQPGHSRKGAIDARIAMWDANAPFDTREAICRLIGVHQVPFFAINGSRSGVDAAFLAREISHQVSLPLLCMLAEADMRGRICPDQQEVLDAIELFRELAREDGCYGQAREFANAHTALSYFRGANIDPRYPLHQECGSQVIVMSGLPASGKNTWVERHHPDLPVVSFDDARVELGLKHGKNEGMVAHRAVDKAKALLRAKAPFVWNATHLTPQARGKTLDLLFSYHAQVDLVYLEMGRAELLRRNDHRDTSLSNKALQAMLLKWDIPMPTEAHMVRYLEKTERPVAALQRQKHARI